MDRNARDESTVLAELRERLRKMNDEELVRFGRVCSQKASTEAPTHSFVAEIDEAQAEWRRRRQRSLTPF